MWPAERQRIPGWNLKFHLSSLWQWQDYQWLIGQIKVDLAASPVNLFCPLPPLYPVPFVSVSFLPLIVYSTDLTNSSCFCQQGTFLSSFPFAVSSSWSLIPTSGSSWYEAFCPRCYCWCLLVLLLFSKLHLWRTKPFNSNMNPAACLSTRGREGDKALKAVSVV